MKILRTIIKNNEEIMSFDRLKPQKDCLELICVKLKKWI